MCGNGLIRMRATALRGTVLMSPAETLIGHLGLVKRAAAKIEDMYSGPIATDVVPLVPGEHRAAETSTTAGESRDREAA